MSSKNKAGGGDVIKHVTSSPDKHPKSGPRAWTKGEYEDFDFNYGQIDWSKKSRNPVEVSADEPVCIICNGESPEGTCAGCN